MDAGLLGMIQFDGLEARQLALASFALLCALCVRHGTYTVLRVPLLVTVSCLILIDLACYGLVRMAVKLVEWVWVVGYKRRDQRMRRSTYTEWVESGSALDKLERLDLWKEDPESRAYNWRQVQAVTRRLRDARERAQGLAPSRSRSAIFELESLLLPTLVKNYAGVGSAELYLKTHVGTKRCVEEYIDEVCASLEAVRAYAASSPLAAAETVPFWRQAQISFGNSALLLSGGAMMGIYHYGVVRALIERGALPRVISGTSAGSVVAAFLAVRTDEEIIFELRSLDNLYREQGSDGPLHGSHWWKLKKLLTTGVLYSLDEFKAHLCWFTRGLTFREAFLVTGRVISITCTPHKRMSASSPPLILNHITAPNVTIASAVCASSCVPGLIDPVELEEKCADGKIRPRKDHGLDGAFDRAAKPAARQASAESAASSDGGAAAEAVGGAAPRGGRVAAAEGPGLTAEPTEGAASAAVAAAASLGTSRTLAPPLDEAATLAEGGSAESIRMRDGSFEFDIPKHAISAMFNVHFSIVSQVNPHILPFTYSAEGSYGMPNLWRRGRGGWRGGFLLSTLETALKEDMLKWLRVMRSQKLGPSLFGVDWSQVFLQDNQGDITLSPTVPLVDYWNVISNASSRAQIERMVAEGEQITWRAMPMIESRLRVQRLLDAAIDDPLLTSGPVSLGSLGGEPPTNCDANAGETGSAGLRSTGTGARRGDACGGAALRSGGLLPSSGDAAEPGPEQQQPSRPSALFAALLSPWR